MDNLDEIDNGIDYTIPKKACKEHRNRDYTLCRDCEIYVDNDIMKLYDKKPLCPKCIKERRKKRDGN